jgi:WD40-like Beta Propeller Repeat
MTARWERTLHRLREVPVPLERVRERAEQPPRRGSPLPPMRERVIAGVMALAVFAAVAAFGWRAFTKAGGETAPLNASPTLPASPFSLWLSAERVPPGPVELVAVLLNHDGGDATFGVLATVDRWDGREWVPSGKLVVCMDHWHCTARVHPPGDTDDVPAIGLTAKPGSPGPVERFTTDGLDVGWYRISQEANEGIVAAAVFEIAEGAPAPAPLVSIDAPAISVTPTLVSPDGAQIDLYPLIPAPTGAQSREDVLRAIRGLSGVAEIERWNGSTWAAAGSIQLHETDDDLTRSAKLPPLPEGAYRLVREGPEGEHIGDFWVDETSVSPSPGADEPTPAEETPTEEPLVHGSIVFTREEPGGGCDLFTIEPLGTGPKALTATPSTCETGPAVAPGGSTVAVSMGLDDIAVIDFATSALRQLTDDPRTFDVSPTWSPDGSQIAFSRGPEMGPKHLFVMDADGSDVRQLTRGSESDANPAWSPDGSRIAFARSGEVYVMDADGSNITGVTSVAAESAPSPVWSPDGSQIALDVDGAIYAMSADGSGLRRLSPDVPKGVLDMRPSWSPDGTQISFERHTNDDVADSAEDGDIWVVDVDGTELIRVTRGRGIDWGAQWVAP